MMKPPTGSTFRLLPPFTHLSKGTFALLLMALLSVLSLDFISAQATLCAQLGGLTYTPLVSDPNITTIYTSDLPQVTYLNQRILIRGNQTLVVNSRFALIGCKLKMEPGSAIRVRSTSQVFTAANCKFFSCGGMWAGMFIDGPAGPHAVNLTASHIEDARTAITIGHQFTNVLVKRCVINRNDVGIAATGHKIKLIATGNLFDCSSPMNDGSTRSTAAVKLQECPSATIGVVGNDITQRNTFKNQTTGISAANSLFIVGLATVELCIAGIQADACQVTVLSLSNVARNLFKDNFMDI